MIEDGGWSCDSRMSTKSNGNSLRGQRQEEGMHRSVGRRKIRKNVTVVLVMVTILLCSCIDENRIQRQSYSGHRQRSMIIHVTSFAPPLAPRVSTLSRDKRLLRSSTYINSPSKKIFAGALKVTSSPTSINTTASSTGLSTTSLEKSETKMSIAPIKSPIRISSGKNFIPSGEIDQILDKVDIVALIESYGLPGFKRISPLRATCLCPFHDDSNPSLQINGERGIYKCFSCGAGGNALKFVREYSQKYPEETRRLKGGIVDATKTNEPLTFVEAIRVLEYSASTMPMLGGVPMRQWSSNTGNSTSSRGSQTKKQKSQRQVGSTSRERILHANLFAAAYFEESLFGLPSAGSARMHLRSRGVHPTTVKAFAMGFAPETYFLGGKSRQGSQQQRSWGEGSLVYRLRDEGFTPQEILDAGLAIVTRKGKEQQKQQQLQLQKEGQNITSFEENNSAAVPESHHEHKDYSTLMDRFRGRLIVPIFNAEGTHVLGFGGRILETSQDTNMDFKAAKYLNSPESLVFQKKELLFGNHMVKFDNNALDSALTASSNDVATVAAQRRPRSVVIVEGYMDAIALWQAGVKETVASMGTALTKEQLLVATEKARDIGGRVVLCLDNDNAGVAAVKRLCSGPDPILLSVVEESNIEIFVAELHGSIKDPAEFLEELSDIDKALDEKFRAEVIDGAQEWTRWYMNSLIADHNSIAPNITGEDDGGFSQVFDSLATFLSVFESVDDRMKKAAAIAPKLADLVAADTSNNNRNVNRTEISGTARIQLASDLIEKAANIAHMKSRNFQNKYRLESRNEAIVPKSLEIGSGILNEGSKSRSNQKKSPETPQIETSSIETRSSKWEQEPPAKKQDAHMKRGDNFKRFQTNNNYKKFQANKSFKQFQKSITKHIAGVSISQFDDEWLGATTDKFTNERIPLRFDGKNQKDIGPEEFVRFNKNNYHGTWTTPRSVAAGYTSQANSKTLDFLERGTSSLIGSDGDGQSLFVEDLLFSILARFSEARQSLYESIRISEASGSGSDVQWSIPEKEWLFKCLVLEIGKIPPEIVGLDDLSELRSYLSLRADAFPGALGSIMGVASETDSKIESSEKVEDSLKPLPIVDVSVDAKQTSSYHKKPQNVEKVPNYEGDIEFLDEVATEPLGQLPMNSIPKIPAIGEEWPDFAQSDGIPDFGEDYGGFDEQVVFGNIDDTLMDSVGPILESFDPSESQEQIDGAGLMSTPSGGIVTGNLMANDLERVGETEIVNETDETDSVGTLLVENEDEEKIVAQEGVLDRLFMEGTQVCEIFNKYYADEDAMSLGSNEDKSNYAAQDLYTILQFTSVLKRVEAGRSYIRESKEDWFNVSSVENQGMGTSTADKDASAISTLQNIELLEYCSSHDPDVGLRSDLRRLRNLAEKNNQATERILDMMDADFADRSADVRGYSWLGNVLKVNAMKMVEWNDVMESKENFVYSQEGVEDLEDVVYSDWNELCDEGEMWEFDKNVDLNHRSHFVDLLSDRPDNECPDSFTERYEAEWDVESWEHEHDENQERGEEELDDGVDPQDEVDEFPENLSQHYESDSGDHDN